MNLRPKFVLSIGLLSLLCLVLPGSLRADTIYSYTGNPYTVNLGTYSGGTYSLSVSFDVAAGTPLDSLAPDTNITADVTSFSFTDNHGLSITPANLIGASDQFYVGTDSSGDITTWFVVADGTDAAIPGDAFHAFSYSPFPPPFATAPYYADESQLYVISPFSDVGLAFNENLPGTWTSSVTSTPEPSSFSLFGTLLGLAAAAALNKCRAVLGS
jgi:hypothetical protein